MNVTVEELAPCRKLIRVEVDSQAVDEAFQDMTHQFQRKARLSGFRPGKAPRAMVARTYAKDIEEEVKRKLISDHYQKALDEKKISVVARPDIEEIQFSKGQPLQFAARVETAPEFDLPEYKGIRIAQEPASVTEADVQRAFQALREQAADYRKVERAVQPGDFVVVNYRGASEGKPLTEFAPTARGLTEQKNFWVHIEHPSFIPGFTDQLVGAKAGEKRTVTVDFPADFVTPQLAGRQGTFEVEIVEVKEQTLPELTEEFAKKYGAESLDKLREGVRRDLQNELDYKRRRGVRNQLVDHLLQRVNFDLPESILNREIRNVIYDIVQENAQRGVSRKTIDAQRDEIFQVASRSAKDRVKAAFLLNRIAEKEGLTVQDREIAERVVALAQQYQIPPEKMARQLRDRGGLDEIREQLLTGKVLDLLEQHARVDEIQTMR